jgi:hypothetical protein
MALMFMARPSDVERLVTPSEEPAVAGATIDRTPRPRRRHVELLKRLLGKDMLMIELPVRGC